MPTDDTNFDDELRALMAAGRKIEAIKRYRVATGAGLADAKDAVEALERDQALPPRESATSPFENEILSLLKQGRKIEAIKLYREKTGVGLKEAKDFIDALAADQHIGTPSKSGCLGVVLLLILVPLAAIVLGCEKRDAAAPSKLPTLTDALAVIKSKRFVDLTHAFEPGVPHWPGFPDEKRETLYWYEGDKGKLGKGFFAEQYTHVGQWGTHCDPPAHSLEIYILGTDHYQIELLTNLDKVPEAGAIVVATFPKPKDGSGFPARVFTIVP